MLLTIPELWPSPSQKHCLHVQSGSESLAGEPPWARPRPPSRTALSLPTLSPAVRKPAGGRGGPRGAAKPAILAERPAAEGSSLVAREPRRGWRGGQPGWRPSPAGAEAGRGCKALPGVAGRSGAAQRGVTAAQVTISLSPSPGQGERALNHEADRATPPGRREDVAARLGPPQDQPLNRVLRGTVGHGARKYLPGGLTAAGGRLLLQRRPEGTSGLCGAALGRGETPLEPLGRVGG